MTKSNGIKLKTINFFLFFTLCCFSIKAQVLTQDAKGKSTLLNNGGVIGFNIQESAIDFSYNNFLNKRIESPSSLMIGINLQAKNNSGISNLFDAGKFTPGGRGLLFLGYAFQIRNSNEIVNDTQENENSKFLYTIMEKFQQKLFKTTDLLSRTFIYNNDVINTIDSIIKNSPHNDIERNFLNLSKNYPEFSVSLDSIRTYTLTEINNYYKTNEFIENLDKTNKKTEIDYRSRNWIKRITVFADFGLSARSFKYLNKIDTTNFSNSFENKYFNGITAEIGVNYQLGGRYLFGLSLGVQRVDNFELLTQKDFVLKTTFSNSSQELKSEKNITAYMGDYGTFYQYTINADVLRFVKLGESNVLLVNPYIRHNISSNPNYIPNTTNVGISTFIFKDNGSFLGGLYVEAPDVFNNIEKSKTQPDLKPIYNRLTFGIIGKLIISSIKVIN